MRLKSLHGEQPAFTVGIAERQRRILCHRLVDVRDGALDGRNHIDCTAVAMNRAQLLALANPLAALR